MIRSLCRLILVVCEHLRVFKSYMSVSSLVVAALPIPLAATGTIPVFAEQKGIFAACSSLLCFLVLGFIFYMRHALASWMLPRGVSRLGVASASVLRGSASEGEAGQVARRHQRAKRVARLSKSVAISVLLLVLIGVSSFFAISYYNTLDATASLIAHSLEYPDPGGKNAGDLNLGRFVGLVLPNSSEIRNFKR
jgi:hypothetical protein